MDYEAERQLMTLQATDSRQRRQRRDQWLPCCCCCLSAAAAAALIYEIVWFQMLELYVGSSSVSIGVLLGTFMGGMCLGSFLLPRFISPRHHPLRSTRCSKSPSASSACSALRPAACRPRVHRHGADTVSSAISCAASPRASVSCPRRSPWAPRFRPSHDGCKPLRRRVVARIFLRGQHCRRGFRIAARGLLPVARVRHERGHVSWPRPLTSASARLGCSWLRSTRARRVWTNRCLHPQSPVPASLQASARPCMWRSPCRVSARLPPKSSGRAFSACCSAHRRIRSR